MTSPGQPTKAEFRRLLRESRPDLVSQKVQSEAIRLHLAEWLGARPPTTIAIFAPLPGEPDLLPLPDSIPGHRWLLPRVSMDRMTFHPFARRDDLMVGEFGISEPPPGVPAVDVREIDVFLCPGLGFSVDGVRLGRGKGYYDRTLAGSRLGNLRVGVAFREQILPAIPSEPHDLPMHRLLSPDGWIDPS